MTGVEHAYQYSVEVKSRFSLFLDDSVNSEDPHLLLSKLQSKRPDKVKKDTHKDGSKKGQPVARSEAKQTVPVQEAEPKVTVAKDVVRDTKPKVAAQPPTEVAEAPISEQPVDTPAIVHPFPRARPEAYRQGFRNRPRVQHSFNEAPLDPSGDVHAQRYDGSVLHKFSGFPPEGRRMRNRGRFRGRGFHYTDYREPQQHGYDRSWSHKGDGHIPNAPHDVQVNGEMRGQMDGEVAVTDGHEDVVGAPAAKEEEEEPKTYTLEEYKAMRSNIKPVVTLTSKEIRKANDGKDVFANMVAHRKICAAPTEEVEHVEKEPERDDAYEISVTFTDWLNERESGVRDYTGRGYTRGRGGPGFRGGRSRGGFRGRGYARRMLPEHQTAPLLNSDQDFPSLK